MAPTDLTLACKTGLWTASIAAVLIAVAAITATAAIQPFATIVGFLVVPAFIVTMACIYATAPDNRRFFGLIGLSFALIYGTLISFNYYVNLTFIRQGVFDVAVFNMSNPNSIFWVIEILGYFFMGLATLFAAPVFVRGRLEMAIKWLFVINGVLGIGGLIGYAYSVDLGVLFGGFGLIVWDIILPVATGLVAYRFLIQYRHLLPERV